MTASRLCTSALAVLFMPAAGVASAAAPAADVPALIDKLTDVADSDVGYSSACWGDSFLPLDCQGSWGGGLLFQKPEVPSDTLRTIVKAGAAAVPHLIAHLDDKRLTKITTAHNFGPIGGLFFDDDCDYNVLTAKENPNPKKTDSDDITAVLGRQGSGDHILTVGDLCFVALGQIVNRQFNAVRYQPTAIIIVASPTESPTLRATVKKQWDQLTPQRHKASLIDDFQKPDSEERRIGACKRLAYFYPDDLEPLVLKILDKPSDEKARFIREGLIYDDSRKIDAAVRDLLTETNDDSLGFACMTRLAGRGYDTDIQKYCRRRLPFMDEHDRKSIQQYLDKAGWTRLHTAVERGNVDEIRRRIAEKMDVNAAAKDGRTPLHLAAAAGDLEAVRALLDGKAGLNVKDSAGRTAVELAAREGHDDVVILLAQSGCEPSDVLSAGIAGKTEVVEALLKKDPKQAAARNVNEATPLHLAARYGHARTAATLLTAGALVNAHDKDGWTPLHFAVDGGYEKVVRLLLDNKANPNAINNRADKISPLHAAVLSGKRSLVELLIDRGADPNGGYDGEIGSPLHLAATRGLTDMVAALLDKGATENLKNKEGWTPLHLAAQAGCDDVVRVLLNHKANVNERGTGGARPLHEAAKAGRLRVVQLLLDHKADVNAEDGADRTPLDNAAAGNQPEVVSFLLEKGANDDGRTALEDALENDGGSKVMGILLRHKAGARGAKMPQGMPPLHLAAALGDWKSVQLILNHGVEVDATDGDGRTALHWAANVENVLVAQELLDKRAAVNVQAKDGSTPLHLAVANGNLLVVMALLGHEADPTIKNAKGETPHDLLPTKGEPAKHAAAIKPLLEHAMSSK